MIFRVIKRLYEKNGDFALRDEIGNMICKAAYIEQGYYIYNKRGSQIAQLVFNGNNSAMLSVISDLPAYPGTVRMTAVAVDEFIFDANVIDRGDDEYISKIRGKAAHNFSLWGRPSAYGFDIYDGSDTVANVIPYPADDEIYQVRVNENSNLLYVFMICLAAEKLNADFGKKKK